MERIGLLLAAGCAASALGADRVTPQIAPRGTMPERHVAHIYFNLATGERVATLIDGGARPAYNGVSPTVWVSDNTLPCADFGQTGGTAGVMDDPFCTTCLTSTMTGVIYLEWADIDFDQVIDCVGVTWGSFVRDTDSDGDGVGDGVEGFAGTWVWFDADDGFDSSASRMGITGFTLLNLAGLTGTFDPGIFATYTATVDLAGTASSTGLVFEIGDTDSSSSAAIFNPGVGNTSDLDSDWHADFSYAFQYTQPGTFDFDNADGDSDVTTGVDGDPALQDLTGWTLTSGNGVVSADGAFYSPEMNTPGDAGAEDAFDIFVDTNSDGELEPIGTFWYGGFHCDIDGNGSFEPGANSNPWTQFRMIMYSPAFCACCYQDIAAPFGLLNFFDVMAYIEMYNNGDPEADLVAPFGELNFFDVSAYIDSYLAGCP